MQHDDFVAAIRNEGAAFDRAVRAAGADALVASCPGWTVADLVAHVGRIHRWVTRIVADRPRAPAGAWWDDASPEGEELFDWFTAGVAQLATALADAGPLAATWTWTPDGTAGFWARRQAHELAVHRWDAQAAAGSPEPVARELAVDGIQEVFDLLVGRGADRFVGDGESVHVHCTDGEGEWTARATPRGLVVDRVHGKGDVALRGAASDLLLVLWGRLGTEHVELFGDGEVFAHFQERARA